MTALASSPVATPSPTTRAPAYLAVFKADILEHVIAPKIEALFDADPFTSKADAHRRFCQTFGCSVSAQTFSGWLDTLGYEFRRVACTPPSASA